jgi:hypothetical protein
MAVEKQKGKVVVEKGEYFLEMPDHLDKAKKELIALSPDIDKETIAPFAGNVVEVIFSEPIRYVVSIISERPKLPPILCYKPRPDLIKTMTVDPKIKEVIVKQLVDAGDLSREAGEYILR